LVVNFHFRRLASGWWWCSGAGARDGVEGGSNWAVTDKIDALRSGSLGALSVNCACLASSCVRVAETVLQHTVAHALTTSVYKSARATADLIDAGAVGVTALFVDGAGGSV